VSEKNETKTILGPDCRVTGQIQLDGDAIIQGEFDGEIRVGGMLELTETSKVKGTVVAGALRLGGTAQADIIAEHGMELLATAQLTGQLYTSRLSVVDGAMFEGHVVVGPKAMEAAGELVGGAKTTRSNGQTKSQPDVNTVPHSLDDILQRRRSGNGKAAVANTAGNGQDDE